MSVRYVCNNTAYFSINMSFLGGSLYFSWVCTKRSDGLVDRPRDGVVTDAMA